MKQIYKKYLFSNFSENWTDSKIYQNKLFYNESLNINTTKNIIEPTKNFSNYFEKKIANPNQYVDFINKYKEILQKIIYLTDYEFFDEIEEKRTIRYFLLDNEYSLYEVDFLKAEIIDFGYKFKAIPNIIKEDGYVYFFTDLGVLIVDGINRPQIFEGVLNIRQYEYFDENLFFVSKEDDFNVYYCEKTQLINLSNNTNYYKKISFNNLGGKILKILKYKDELFIFQQYKISSFNLYATKNIITNYVFNSKIIENTIALVDNKIVFLTKNGFKVFDGSNCNSLFFGLEDYINFDFEKIFAFVFNDKYYINLECKINTEYKNVLLEIFSENEKLNFYYFEKDINNFSLIRNSNGYESLLFVGEENKVLSLDGAKFSENFKYIKFNKISFDNSEKKQIQVIKLISSGNFKMKIKSDIDEFVIEVFEGVSDYKLNLNGHIFELSVESYDDFSISSILIEVMTIEDVL